MDLKIFNTLKREEQEFKPSSKEKVKLYTCGPTVYNFAHIGNLRAYISADILKRALGFAGFDVQWVMNITDVDDKTIANTIKEFGQNSNVPELQKFTQKYFEIFLEDLEKIGVNHKSIEFVKVTEKIADIQEYIVRLIEKGYAYKAEDGSAYFNIEKYQKDFGDYGQLVGEKFLEGKKVGARVKVDEYEKDNLSDFALWKAHGSDDAQIYWDHPLLGRGRPGWHIECTLINFFKFPDGTDIHTGGVDLIFPHHTNEIAQAQPIYKPFVKYWMHSEHILVDGKKMAKSAGNFWTLDDLEKQGIADGLSLRYLVLQSHYRSKLNVTKESLSAAKNGLKKLREEIGALITESEISSGSPADKNFLKQFEQALYNDLNTPEAVSVMFGVLKSDLRNEVKLSTILKMDEVFGLDLEHTFIKNVEINVSDKMAVSDQTTVMESLNIAIQQLLEQRIKAKEQKDYKLSDQLRKQIEEHGFEVTDTPSGMTLKKK